MGSRQDLTPQEPVMVRRQRRGRASTAPTIGPPFVPQLISRRQRSTERKKRAPPPPSLTAGDPTARWQRSRPIGCSRRGDRDMLRRGTPVLHHNGVVVRRAAMSVFESCGNRNTPATSAPPKLQPTIGHDQFAKSVPNHGCSCPLYANLSERLRDVDLTQHYTCARPETPTQIQDAPKGISQHCTTQLLRVGGCAKSVSALTLRAY